MFAVQSNKILSNGYFLLKFLLVIINIYASITLDISDLLVIYVILLLFLITKFYILKFWLFTLMRIIPFFLSLLILGFIFQLDYFIQLHLILKISFIILQSVFLVKSIDLHQNLSLLNKSERNTISSIKLYFFATLKYISILLDYFNTFSFRKSNFSDIISDTIALNENGYFHANNDPIYNATDKSSKILHKTWENLLIILLIFIICMIIWIKS